MICTFWSNISKLSDFLKPINRMLLRKSCDCLQDLQKAFTHGRTPQGSFVVVRQPLKTIKHPTEVRSY